ncbi:MAG: hypothetical protein HKN10_11985 [Myxococcales bacterium]|nr:hypothetical protein [Myxococcales bacterium]
MTERKKSQGPSHLVVGASALAFCAVLVGAAYWLRVDAGPAAVGTSTLATSKLHSLYERCEEGPSRDVFDGRPRTRCSSKAHPAFMMEVIEDGDQVERASMLVPMGGTMNQLLDRMLLGLEMFGLVAGVGADVFLPKEYMDSIGTSETKLVYQGRVYLTQPVDNLGLIFLVTSEVGDSAPAN